MLIFPFALVAGSFVGWSIGGSWRFISEVRFRHVSLLLGAISAQIALELPALRGWSSSSRFAVVVATYLVVGWWLFENARHSSTGARLGLALVGGGWALNLLAIIPNGGMPVSRSAIIGAGISSTVTVNHGHLSKHVLASHGTVLRLLGDVLPIPWLRSVVSVGDIFMAVGIVALLAAAMRPTTASAIRRSSDRDETASDGGETASDRDEMAPLAGLLGGVHGGVGRLQQLGNRVVERVGEGDPD
jgi:hypothetical protein